MKKVFLKKEDLQLSNGGYLSDKDGNPVGNQEFVAAQKQAEYIIEFAKAAKGKDFVGKQADSIQSVRNEVSKTLAAKDIKYVEAGKKPIQKITKGLADEALAFIKFNENSTKTEKVNNFLQRFNVISEFEEIGLFFEDQVVKVNKIYTIKEIVAAVEEVIDLL